MRNAFLIIGFAVLLSGAPALYANDLPMDVVIVDMSIDAPMIQALSGLTVEAIKEAFTSSGQLVPIDLQSFEKMTQFSAGDITGKAVLHGVSLIVYMRVFLIGPVYYCELAFKPLSDVPGFTLETVTVQGTVARNIPLKAKREIIKRHADTLRFFVKQKIDDHTYSIGAGQWHGLESTTYETADGRQIAVTIVHRYTALIQSDKKLNKGDSIEINRVLNKAGLIESVNADIRENIYSEYTGGRLLKGDSHRKRSIEACCIVNPFGNILLPGYGAYLATHYLGFTHEEPHWGGVYGAAGITALQLALVPLLGKGDVNFFPWNRDSGKTRAHNRLHVYLWATLPITYTAAFFDQLAYAYEKHRLLPPFFLNRDTAAVIASVIVPGGGLFYKGHRWYGYSYWLTEFALGGMLAYHWENEQKRTMFAGALAGIKLLELVHAFLAAPAYTVYQYELSHTAVPFNVGIGGYDAELCFYAYFSKNY